MTIIKLEWRLDLFTGIILNDNSFGDCNENKIASTNDTNELLLNLKTVKTKLDMIDF